MAKGRKTGGRKKGTPNKAKARVEEIMAKAVASAQAEGLKWTPLEWFLFILNDPNTPRRERTEVAKAAAPYLHAWLNAIETVSTTKTHEQRLAKMRALLDDLSPCDCRILTRYGHLLSTPYHLHENEPRALRFAGLLLSKRCVGLGGPAAATAAVRLARVVLTPARWSLPRARR